MKEYVVGFGFTENPKLVVMIHKNRPEKGLVGLINGIGGLVEAGESPSDAMSREFMEETGLPFTAWERYAFLTGGQHAIHFYRATSNLFHEVKTVTDETVELVNPQEIFAGWRRTMDNTPTVLAAAMNPTIDSSVYTKLQQMIQAGRADFKASQDQRIDRCRAYRTELSSPWNGLWLRVVGYPKFDLDKSCQVVVVGDVQQIFETGTDRVIQLR